jgi:pimeloyl-ACP methyl ester carboxylesterase
MIRILNGSRRRDDVAASLGSASSPVYHSAAGRAAVLTAYKAQAARIPFRIETEFVPTSFGMTHVVWAGPADAPPIVVVSGVNFGAFFTLEWLERLVPHFRLIIPDVVGQPNLSAETRPKPEGHEYARWLREVLEQLDVGAVPMIGFSFGGAIVLDLASSSPSLVSKAALVVPGGFAGGNFLNVVWRLLVPWSLYRFNPSAARVPKLVSPLGDDLPAHWYDFFDLLLRHVRWAVMPPGPFSTAQLADYAGATLAVFAMDDCFFPGEKAAAAARKALGPNVVTRLISGKHVPAAAELAAIQSELLTFLGD